MRSKKDKNCDEQRIDGFSGERLFIGHGISLIEIFVSHRRVISTSIDSGSRSWLKRDPRFWGVGDQLEQSQLSGRLGRDWLHWRRGASLASSSSSSFTNAPWSCLVS